MTVLELALKALAGGGLVLVFSAISEVVRPKLLAGVFAAAPAVALAGLLLTVLFKSAHDAYQNSMGMVAGGIAIACYSTLVTWQFRNSAALRASLLVLPAWFAVAFTIYLLALR